ncbi:MAG: L-threonylcarbamoyladenylate synthase [Candidatus Bathyarchaeia archaeon]
MARILKADLEGLTAAVEVVRKGGLICYPTDTVYGLGCNPLDSSAVERARGVKGVPTRPLPVLVKDIGNAERLAQIPDRARKLARKFWPGPLTLVLPALGVLPENLVTDGTVGLRSPKHPICLTLLGLCSGALVGTSANLTGKPPAVSAEEAARDLGDRVDLILDGGRAPLGVASTVVNLTKPTFAILREGPIGAREIMICLRGGNP